MNNPIYTDNSWKPAIPYTLTSSGSYTLQFEVSGVQYSPISWLGLDNAKLTPGVAQVPLPGAVVLGAIGLSFAGWRLKRGTR